MKEIKYLPLFLMGAFCLKTLAIGLNWESVAVIVALATFYGFLDHKLLSAEAIRVQKELDNLKAQVKEQQIIAGDLKNAVSSLRTATGLKQQPRNF
jgi:hypothetical protein